MQPINSCAEKQIEEIKKECERIKPLVAIRSLAYNHGPYIRDSLEGFVKQKTDFPFVAIVHDDASTDDTAKIIQEYAEKCPDIIKPIFEQENQYSKPHSSLSQIMNLACKATGAKYVAMCEGDDYWIDPYKLQKQVDFLETHPHIVYTCHRYQIQNKKELNLSLARNYYLDKYSEADGFEFDFKYVFNCDWITKTLTAVFRIEYLELKMFRDCTYYRDTHFIYNLLNGGNGYCFQFIGGVYRKQETGVWSQGSKITNAYTDVKKWWEIYSFLPTKFNLWKYRLFYANYVKESIKGKKWFKIRNINELKALLTIPISAYIKYIKRSKSKECHRIQKLNLNSKIKRPTFDVQ